MDIKPTVFTLSETPVLILTNFVVLNKKIKREDKKRQRIKGFEGKERKSIEWKWKKKENDGCCCLLERGLLVNILTCNCDKSQFYKTPWFHFYRFWSRHHLKDVCVCVCVYIYIYSYPMEHDAMNAQQFNQRCKLNWLVILVICLSEWRLFVGPVTHFGWANNKRRCITDFPNNILQVLNSVFFF